MDGHLRMSDADREQAAAALGEHYAQGRLTADEHGERLDRIWSARTRGELEPLFRDLPDAAHRAPDRRTARREPTYWSSGVGWRGRPPGPVFLVLAALLVLTVVTHVPFVLLGLMVVLFVTARHRRRLDHWRRPMR
jgi:hypothetical protein